MIFLLASNSRVDLLDCDDLVQLIMLDRLVGVDLRTLASVGCDLVSMAGNGSESVAVPRSFAGVITTATLGRLAVSVDRPSSWSESDANGSRRATHTSDYLVLVDLLRSQIQLSSIKIYIDTPVSVLIYTPHTGPTYTYLYIVGHQYPLILIFTYINILPLSVDSYIDIHQYLIHIVVYYYIDIHQYIVRSTIYTYINTIYIVYSNTLILIVININRYIHINRQQKRSRSIDRLKKILKHSITKLLNIDEGIPKGSLIDQSTKSIDRRSSIAERLKIIDRRSRSIERSKRIDAKHRCIWGVTPASPG